MAQAMDMAQDQQATNGPGAATRITDDLAAPGPVEHLRDLIGGASGAIAAGDALDPLAHWVLFHERTPHASRGRDGHPRRGGFLPDLDGLPRRMWAGNDVVFHAPLRAGERVRRVSRIGSVERKSGRSGELGFVTVEHRIEDVAGALLVADRQTLVYRGATQKGPNRVPDGPRHAAPPIAERTVAPDPVMLFAYSALTYNGHRIHYDRDYARGVEGYPDLVVHGPLVATMLLGLARETRPGATVASFSFRALSPLFVGGAIDLRAWRDEDGVEAWAFAEDGRPASRATIRFAEVTP